MHGARQRRIAVEQSRTVERREQPLVRVEDERVGVLDAVVFVPDAGGEQPGAAVGAVNVEPQTVIPCDRGRPGEIVDDPRVRRARRRDDRRERRGVSIVLDGFPERFTGQPMIIGFNGQRVHLDDTQCVDDRGVGVRPDDHAPPLWAARTVPALGHLPRHDERRQVAGGPTGDEASTCRIRQPRPVRDQPEHLVLGMNRACGFQPGDALNRGARDEHVEQQRRLGGRGRDEAQEPWAVSRDHRGREHRGVDAEDLVRIGAVLGEQALGDGIEGGWVT